MSNDISCLIPGHLLWEVVVDDEGDHVDVDTTRPDVRSDEDPAGAASELGHDVVSLFLGHLAVLLTKGELCTT
jgi:hypothetical protein